MYITSSKKVFGQTGFTWQRPSRPVPMAERAPDFPPAGVKVRASLLPDSPY
jgi:hypothetical protein